MPASVHTLDLQFHDLETLYPHKTKYIVMKHGLISSPENELKGAAIVW